MGESLIDPGDQGTLGPCESCPEDVNDDGVVDGQDVAAVVTHFGPCP